MRHAAACLRGKKIIFGINELTINSNALLKRVAPRMLKILRALHLRLNVASQRCISSFCCLSKFSNRNPRVKAMAAMLNVEYHRSWIFFIFL